MSSSRRLAYLVIAVGVAIRIWHLVSARSLYIDEARLALNIGTRDFAGLTRPLDLEQLASVPFLWVVEAGSRLLGMGEIGLRTVPFLAGVALLPVLWALYQRLANERVALLGLLLAAVAPALVRSSNDLKQYSLDALCAGAVLLLAVMVLEDERRLRSKLWFIGAMLLSAVVSLPAPLYLAPLAAGLAVIAARQRRWPDAALFALALGLALAMSFFGYQLLYVVGADSEYMQAYWQGAFLDPRTPEMAGRWAFALSDLTWGGIAGGFPILTNDPISQALRWAVAAVAWVVPAWGAVVLARQHGLWVAFLVLGGTLGLLAAALTGVYPVGIRLWLFALSQWLLLAALGVSALAEAAGSRRAVRGAVLAAALAPGALVSLHPSFWPYIIEDMRDLAQLVMAAPKGRAVYIFANAGPAWTYYSTDWSNPDLERLQWYLSHSRYGGLAFENAQVWRPAVPDGLVWRGSERSEVLGTTTAQYWRPYFGPARDGPPPEWAVSEADRIMAEANGTVELLFAHYRGSENGLLERLEQKGASLMEASRYPGAILFRYSVPPK